MSHYLSNQVTRRLVRKEVFPFVMVANVSAALTESQTEAKRLSLTAKNARALAIRAGEKAAGFKEITNFIDEFANKTIEVAQRIHKQSIAISSQAKTISESKDLLASLQKANKKLTEGSNRSLEDMIFQKNLEISHLENEFVRDVDRLRDMLLEIKEQMRAAMFIASTSKVEAVQAEEYRKNLDNVALSISKAADKINRATEHCLTCLGNY